MKLRDLRMPILAVLVALVGGCGGTAVQAIAPGSTETQTGTVPQGGQYVLYRATGFDHDPAPTVERLWVVTAPRGTKLGFKWATDKGHQWDAFGANHLEAFAGGQIRDLGTYTDRDSKYVWAGADTDMTGYFRHAASQRNLRIVTMQ
jgi:hypothetical protein